MLSRHSDLSSSARLRIGTVVALYVSRQIEDLPPHILSHLRTGDTAMVMTLPLSQRSEKTSAARRESQPMQSQDLLPWADPYIASLIAAHEKALRHEAKEPRS
jgi:hypothetical protein